MSCTFKYCCGCLNLRYGTILIGIYYSISYLALASYSLAITNSYAIIGGSSIASFSFVKGIIICSITGFITSICLVYGAIEEKTLLITPWLAVNCFMPVTALAGVIWGTLLYGKFGELKDPFIVLFISLAALCLMVYCIIVVHSYRQQLISEQDKQVNTDEDNYFGLPKRAYLTPSVRWSKYLQSEAMKNAYI